MERAVDTEPAADTTSPEYRLWAEALGQLVRDALAHWRGKGQPACEPHELEQAFDDLCRAGPMTRYVCSALEVEAQTVSEQFIRHLEAMA